MRTPWGDSRRRLRSETLRVPHALGFRRVRRGDNDEIGPCQQGVEIVRGMNFNAWNVVLRARIDPEHGHAKRLAQPGRLVADAPYPDDDGGGVREVDVRALARLLIPALLLSAPVLAQDPEGYTLQLLSTSQESAMRQFLERHRFEEPVATFHYERNGKALIGLVHGAYPGPSAAKAAAERVRKSVAGVDPWVRRLRSVQADAGGSGASR